MKTSKRLSHKNLVEKVGVCVRKMGAQGVVISETVATMFGLHTTDLEVLDLIYLRQTASAGDIANATGLTSGSVTALIDRLAAAGYVERRADPEDGRRVLVCICPDAIEPIKAVYMKLQTSMFKLWSTYESGDLETIADFLSRSAAISTAHVRELTRANASAKKPAGSKAAKRKRTK